MVKKTPSDSSWKFPPTRDQCRAITKLCMALGIREELELTPSNRWEARRLMYDLRLQLSVK